MLCAYVFFLLGLVLQRLVMLPVASAVFQQEAAEGAFRYGHTRFRAWAAEIAMYRCEGHCHSVICHVVAPEALQRSLQPTVGTTPVHARNCFLTAADALQRLLATGLIDSNALLHMHCGMQV